MIEPHRRTIDGFDFELTPLPAWASLETFPRITKFLSPVVDGLGDVGGDRTMALKGVAKAIQGLSSSNPAELKALTQKLLESCLITYEGKQVRLLTIFDIAMQARLLTVFKVLAWAVEVNYQDFFDVLKSGLSAIGSKTGFLSKLQTPSSPSGPATE
jgi:hypothetical protein